MKINPIYKLNISTSKVKGFNSLSKGIVDIYYVKVSDLGPGLRAQLLRILNEAELRVYKRFMFEHKKSEFLVGRYLIKSILAHHLKIKPQEILFHQNNYGKLSLSNKVQSKVDGRIKFNLSHSCGMVVCVTVLEYDVGVDVEKVNGNIFNIVERFFHRARFNIYTSIKNNCEMM